jgi:spermidine synthase
VIDYLLIILFVLGPAKALFEQPYYKLMMEALQPGGIIASQGRVQVHNSDQHATFDCRRMCLAAFRPHQGNV